MPGVSGWVGDSSSPVFTRLFAHCEPMRSEEKEGRLVMCGPTHKHLKSHRQLASCTWRPFLPLSTSIHPVAVVAPRAVCCQGSSRHDGRAAREVTRVVDP